MRVIAAKFFRAFIYLKPLSKDPSPIIKCALIVICFIGNLNLNIKSFSIRALCLWYLEWIVVFAVVGIQECNIRYLIFNRKDRIKQCNKQIFIFFNTEQLFEGDIYS
jgi:hypothetical protein